MNIECDPVTFRFKDGPYFHKWRDAEIKLERFERGLHYFISGVNAFVLEANASLRKRKSPRARNTVRPVIQKRLYQALKPFLLNSCIKLINISSLKPIL